MKRRAGLGGLLGPGGQPRAPHGIVGADSQCVALHNHPGIVVQTESVQGIQNREGPGQTPSEPGGEARAGGRAADSQELGRCGAAMVSGEGPHVKGVRARKRASG